LISGNVRFGFQHQKYQNGQCKKEKKKRRKTHLNFNFNEKYYYYYYYYYLNPKLMQTNPF